MLKSASAVVRLIQKSVMDDCFFLSEVNVSGFYFCPLSGKSQTAICQSLHLPLISKHPPQPPVKLTKPSKLQQIQGDGNCLFRSFSYALTGRQVYYNLLRTKITDFMSDIPHVLYPHILSSVDHYLTLHKMQNDKVWGTDIEILTASWLFQTDIYVYSKFGYSFRWSRFSKPLFNTESNNFVEAIYLQNLHGVHYEVVLGVGTGETTVSHSISPYIE